MFAHVVAAGQEVGPFGLVVLGSICVLLAGWLCVAAFNARWRAKVRWSDDGSGPRLSRLGTGAFALNALLLGIMFFAQALKWPGTSTVIFRLLLGSIFVTAALAFRDYSRDRGRI